MPYGLKISEVTDPVKFQNIVLQRYLWGLQRRMVRSARNNRHTAVRGCHASGKTMAASGLPLYWLLQDKQSACFQVSPTLRQVKIFWNEVGIARDSSLWPFPEVTSTGIKINRERYAFGASASRGVNLQSLHGGLMLIIVDEAMGVAQDIWYAIDGIAAGGEVHILEMGNPTVPGGHFYDSCSTDPTTVKIRISAYDTPNLMMFRKQAIADGVQESEREEAIAKMLIEANRKNPELIEQAVVIPNLIRPAWVLDKYLRWGPKHPAYQGRVLAQFPSQSAWSVFSLEWIERAGRDPNAAEQHVLDNAPALNVQIGIDVAAGGEAETAMAARCNGHLLGIWATSAADPDEQFGFLRARINELRRIPRVRISAAVVDVNGPGYHLAPRLADLDIRVFRYMAGESALEPDQFRNVKAEEYWRCRSYFERNLVSGLEDAETKAQLATIQYKETARGILIEAKAEALKRGVPSPDRAEAVILAFASTLEREVTEIEDPFENEEIFT